MPVFETGAFNHSATCPAASQLIRGEGVVQPARVVAFDQLSTCWRLALIAKEFLQQPRAFVGQDAGAYFGPVIQTRMAKKIAN